MEKTNPTREYIYFINCERQGDPVDDCLHAYRFPSFFWLRRHCHFIPKVVFATGLLPLDANDIGGESNTRNVCSRRCPFFTSNVYSCSVSPP